MRSFRAKPVGWRYESAKHALSARGIASKYRKEFPNLVKPFEGENPRITDKYARFRQKDPKEFKKGSFRTKKEGDKTLILGKDKKYGQYMLQSILVNRKGYFSKIGDEEQKLWSELSAVVEEEQELLEKPRTQQTVNDLAEVRRAMVDVKARLKVFERQRGRDPDVEYFAVKRVLKKGKVHVTKSGAEVRSLADEVVRDIRPYAERVEIVGSIRRNQSPTDADFVIIPKKDEGNRIREIIKDKASRVDAEGEHKLNARVKGVDINMIFTNKREFGSQMLTYTGPWQANVHKRKVAKEKGWKLNEYGLFDRSGRRIASSEREIYKKLGLSYLEPEKRGLPR